MKFKSVFDSLENYYSISSKYENTRHEPKKDQIEGNAMVYLIRFIDWCFRKEK